MQQKFEAWNREQGFKKIFLAKDNKESLQSLLTTPERVEGYKYFIFDEDKGHGLNNDLDAGIEWMKGVKLKDLEYPTVEKGISFKIKKKDSEEGIVCSDRGNQTRELRGALLRDKLAEQDQEQTLYEAIENILAHSPLKERSSVVYYVSALKDYPEFQPLMYDIVAQLHESGGSMDSLEQLLDAAMQGYKEKQDHSELYRQCTGADKKIKAEALSEVIEQSPPPAVGVSRDEHIYERIKDVLRTNIDHQFNVFSVWNQGGWVRNLIFATPLSKLEPASDAPNPLIEGNNMLLRCVSRLQSIDALIGEKYAADPQGHQLREQMKKEYSTLMEQILYLAQNDKADPIKTIEEIHQWEIRYNTLLIQHLHEAHLTEGCTTAAEVERLLVKHCEPKAPPVFKFADPNDPTRKGYPNPFEDNPSLNHKVREEELAFLQRPSTAFKPLDEEFNANLQAYEDSLAEYKPKNESQLNFKNKALALSLDIRAIKSSGVNNGELAQLNAALYYGRKVLDNPADLPNVQRAVNLSESLNSEKRSALYKKLGTILLGFCAAALVTVGIMAAIPSGGSSLLLTGVGIAIASSLASGAAGLALGGTIGIEAKMARPLSPDIAHSTTDFKNALKAVTSEAKQQSQVSLEQDTEPEPNEPRLG